MKQFRLTSEKGKLGESLAKKYLLANGHRVLAENYYYAKGPRSGEIDLITECQGAIRFIEVKMRVLSEKAKKSLGLSFPPEASVTPSKIRKCAKTAHHYLKSERRESEEYHFDTVSILYDPGVKKAHIRYLPDIFY